MNLKRWKQFKTVSGILLLVTVMLLMKIVLSMSHLMSEPGEPKLPVFPSEVMAEERKARGKETADPGRKKQPAQAQPAGSVPDHSSESAEKTQSLPSSAAMTPEMLANLEHREIEIKKKEEQLRQKEEYLVQLEREVEKKLKELSSIQKEIQAYRTEKEDAQSGKIRSLSKIYGSMKPKEAAKLMEGLEDRLVVNIIATLSSDEAASIMASMDVKKAAKIAEALSHR